MWKVSRNGTCRDELLTHEKISKMGLHPFMHHTELGAQSLNIVLDIRLQPLKIEPMLEQRMQNLLFHRMPLRRRTSSRGLLGLLMKALESARELGEVFSRHVCYSVKSSRLEVFEAGMIENLAD